MKKTFIFIIMLGYSFISNSLFSSGGSNPRNSIDPFCGFDDIIKECKMVTSGSVCITYEDCKELVETPTNPIKPEEPEEPIEP